MEWGIEATFPKLQNLTLSFNSLLGGTLPSQWGSDGSSLRSLSKLEINNCHVTGSLPDAWAQNLPSLKDVNVSTNALTGESSSLSFCWGSRCLLISSQVPLMHHWLLTCMSAGVQYRDVAPIMEYAKFDGPESGSQLAERCGDFSKTMQQPCSSFCHSGWTPLFWSV